jgi:RNA polymerase sigma factor (sigma-70 family)
LKNQEIDAWFVAQVLPLEAALTRFLARHWSNQSDIRDLRQEVYVRVYQAAKASLPVQAKPFVFMVARNLMIDSLRRNRLVPISTVADLESLNLSTGEASPERHAIGREELRLLQAALNNVPAKQRETIILHKVEGLRQQEIAERLGVAPKTVERNLKLGMRYLAEALRGTGIDTGKTGEIVEARKLMEFE